MILYLSGRIIDTIVCNVSSSHDSSPPLGLGTGFGGFSLLLISHFTCCFILFLHMILHLLGRIFNTIACNVSSSHDSAPPLGLRTGFGGFSLLFMSHLWNF